MAVQKCGEFESEKKGDESANGVIVDNAATPEKLKIARIANQIIQGREVVAIEPIDRQPTIEEIKKKITRRGERDEESTKGNDENNPGRKDPGRINGRKTRPSDYGGSLEKPGNIVIDHM